MKLPKPYYEDDLVTLYHGDCHELLPKIQGGGLDLSLVTDPPYGIGYKPNGSMPGSIAYESVIGDDEAFDPAPLLAMCVPSILWGANHYASRLPDSKGWLVWRKVAWYVADLEFAWTNCVSKPQWKEVEWRGATRGVERGDHFHPTQKPLAIMRWCIDMSGDQSRTIFDPFAGSGTTLRAAKDMGRRAIGIELDEGYCKIAAERMAQEVLDFGVAA